MTNEVVIANAIMELAKVIDRIGEGTSTRPGMIEGVAMAISEGFERVEPVDYRPVMESVAEALNTIATAINEHTEELKRIADTVEKEEG